MLSVLITMPLLAIPAINQRLNELLHGQRQLTGAAVQIASRKAVSTRGNTQFIPEFAGKVHSGRGVHDREETEIVQIRNQLISLGAVYLRLERLGAGRGYYFVCKVAVPGSKSYQRAFESVDADHLRAMRRVLADIQNWLAGNGAADVEPQPQPTG